jgi:hypothetical protein
MQTETLQLDRLVDEPEIRRAAAKALMRDIPTSLSMKMNPVSFEDRAKNLVWSWKERYEAP